MEEGGGGDKRESEVIKRGRKTTEDRNEEDEEDQERAAGKQMEKGRKGGEQAAAQPGSDYIIALQDLKQGLRRKNTPERSSSRHQANDSDLKNTPQACRITAGLRGSDRTDYSHRKSPKITQPHEKMRPAEAELQGEGVHKHRKSQK